MLTKIKNILNGELIDTKDLSIPLQYCYIFRRPLTTISKN